MTGEAGWQDEVEVSEDGLIGHVAGLVTRLLGGPGTGATVDAAREAWGEPDDDGYDDEDGGELRYERELDDDASVELSFEVDAPGGRGVTRITLEARWDEADADAWRARGLAWMAALEEEHGAPRLDERDDDRAVARWDDGPGYGTLEVALEDDTLEVVIDGTPEPEGSLWRVLRSHEEIADYLVAQLTGEGVPAFGFATVDPTMDCDALIARLGPPRHHRRDESQRDAEWGMALDHDEHGRRDHHRFELSAAQYGDSDAVGELTIRVGYYTTSDASAAWDALVKKVGDALVARYGEPASRSRGKAASMTFEGPDERSLTFRWSASGIEISLAQSA